MSQSTYPRKCCGWSWILTVGSRQPGFHIFQLGLKLNSYKSTRKIQRSGFYARIGSRQDSESVLGGLAVKWNSNNMTRHWLVIITRRLFVSVALLWIIKTREPPLIQDDSNCESNWIEPSLERIMLTRPEDKAKWFFNCEPNRIEHMPWWQDACTAIIHLTQQANLVCYWMVCYWITYHLNLSTQQASSSHQHDSEAKHVCLCRNAPHWRVKALWTHVGDCSWASSSAAAAAAAHNKPKIELATPRTSRGG